MKATQSLLAVASLALGTLPAASQSTALQATEKQPQLTESGKVIVAGRPTPYMIRHLPVSSFPELPEGIVNLLNRRRCLIPQTYEAHHPENVVHASLERSGSSDWAVLCSVEGTVSLLVFFDEGTGESEAKAMQPAVLASAPEAQRLQSHDPSGVLGFNWGIDPASPQRVHDAQIGMEHRPAPLDHDALADSVVEHSTVYHFYVKPTWTLLEMPR
jgi:hypothetical protein